MPANPAEVKLLEKRKQKLEHLGNEQEDGLTPEQEEEWDEIEAKLREAAENAGYSEKVKASAMAVIIIEPYGGVETIYGLRKRKQREAPAATAKDAKPEKKDPNATPMALTRTLMALRCGTAARALEYIKLDDLVTLLVGMIEADLNIRPQNNQIDGAAIEDSAFLRELDEESPYGEKFRFDKKRMDERIARIIGRMLFPTPSEAEKLYAPALAAVESVLDEKALPKLLREIWAPTETFLIRFATPQLHAFAKESGYKAYEALKSKKKAEVAKILAEHLTKTAKDWVPSKMIWPKLTKA